MLATVYTSGLYLLSSNIASSSPMISTISTLLSLYISLYSPKQSTMGVTTLNDLITLSVNNYDT